MCGYVGLQKLSALRQTSSTNAVIPLRILAVKDEGLLARNIRVYIMWIPPVAGFRQSVYPVAGPGITGLPSCWLQDA